MCDTLLFKSLDYTIFAKNSDREPNEAQAILHLPPTKNKRNKLHCTYIEIPQIPNSYEVILSKPFQMWGAEMGINEHGVVIGNEAVFTRIKEPGTNKGLTGMDMIRIALERCPSSQNALETICQLIEKYGQDACGGYQDKRFFYHNSFIIADSDNAFKLETAGRHWIYNKINNYDSISNGLTIDSDYDGISKHAIDFAYQNKWIGRKEDFSFSKAFGSPLMTRLSRSEIRRHCTYLPLKENQLFSVKNAIQTLQLHFNSNHFDPTASTARNVCMHPTGPFNPSQTNGSMVVLLAPNQAPRIWLTGTSNPCLSIYKPMHLGKPIDLGPLPGNQFDKSIWWQAELVHRFVCRDYSKNKPIHKEVFSGLQAYSLLKEAAPQDIWDSYSAKLKSLDSLLESSGRHLKSYNPLYRYRIKKWNKAVGIKI